MKTIKFKSAVLIGLLLWAGGIALNTGLSKPVEVTETLNIAVNGEHHQQLANKVRPGDSLYAEKVMMARIMAGENPWITFARALFSPSEAAALIVNAGETALRDCFIATSCTVTQNFKFHGIGTGSTAAAEANTGCETESTTAYNPDNTRATGSQTNNGANVYRTVGTNTVDAVVAATEFCLMSQAATGGGTMWTRFVYSPVTLTSGDSLQTTYDLTIE